MKKKSYKISTSDKCDVLIYCDIFIKMKGIASLLLMIGIILVIQSYYSSLLEQEKEKLSQQYDKKIAVSKASTHENQFESSFAPFSNSS